MTGNLSRALFGLNFIISNTELSVSKVHIVPQTGLPGARIHPVMMMMMSMNWLNWQYVVVTDGEWM